MSKPGWEYIAKIVSLGDSGCGKSSLTIRLCEGRFVAQHDVTIGVEFGSRIVPVGPPASLTLGINNPAVRDGLGSGEDVTKSPAEAVRQSKLGEVGRKGSERKVKGREQQQEQKHMKLSLWDTAGQETYKSITRSYFRGASGALLVFDITRRETFASVTSWLQDLRQIAEDNIVVVLVGNKSDLVHSRQVSQQEAEDWCRTNDVMQYVETSAKNGEGVERAFLEVSERIFQHIMAGKYDLNDRRSGVKSAAAGGGGGNTAKTVNLSVTDVGGNGAKKSAGGGCC